MCALLAQGWEVERLTARFKRFTAEPLAEGQSSVRRAAKEMNFKARKIGAFASAVRHMELSEVDRPPNREHLRES